MITFIHVLSRELAQTYVSNFATNDPKPFCFISIWGHDGSLTYPNNDPSMKDYKCKGSIELNFWDLAGWEYTPNFIRHNPSVRLFDDTQAEIIVNFIDEMHKLSEEIPLYVHCRAGISRSGAVGMFVCDYLKLDPYTFKLINHKVEPNMYVYKTLKKKAGLINDGSSFK